MTIPQLRRVATAMGIPFADLVRRRAQRHRVRLSAGRSDACVRIEPDYRAPVHCPRALPRDHEIHPSTLYVGVIR